MSDATGRCRADAGTGGWDQRETDWGRTGTGDGTKGDCDSCGLGSEGERQGTYWTRYDTRGVRKGTDMRGDETKEGRTLDEPGREVGPKGTRRIWGMGHWVRSGDKEWETEPRLGMRPVTGPGRAFAWCRFKTCCPGGGPGERALRSPGVGPGTGLRSSVIHTLSLRVGGGCLSGAVLFSSDWTGPVSPRKTLLSE